jgi:hypothetical protein
MTRLSRVLLALGSLALASAASAAQNPAASPKAAVEAERAAVLAATSLDEVIRYVPAEWQDYVKALPKDDKDEQLGAWKRRLGAVRLEEYVAGDRAAVLIESEDSGSLDVRIMEHDGEQWITMGETSLMSGPAGARGSYVVDGSVEASLEEGLIQQDSINGIPLLTIRNELARVLDESTGVPTVVLALQDCMSVGAVELGMREAGNVKIGSSFEAPGADGETAVFRHEAAGILEIESVTEDRFSGTFELTARGERPTGVAAPDLDALRERVTVRGRIENARNPCPAP